jgi:hypothetical protein
MRVNESGRIVSFAKVVDEDGRGKPGQNADNLSDTEEDELLNAEDADFDVTEDVDAEVTEENTDNE